MLDRIIGADRPILEFPARLLTFYHQRKRLAGKMFERRLEARSILFKTNQVAV